MELHNTGVNLIGPCGYCKMLAFPLVTKREGRVLSRRGKVLSFGYSHWLLCSELPTGDRPVLKLNISDSSLSLMMVRVDCQPYSFWNHLGSQPPGHLFEITQIRSGAVEVVQHQEKAPAAKPGDFSSIPLTSTKFVL